MKNPFKKSAKSTAENSEPKYCPRAITNSEYPKFIVVGIVENELFKPIKLAGSLEEAEEDLRGYVLTQMRQHFDGTTPGGTALLVNNFHRAMDDYGPAELNDIYRFDCPAVEGKDFSIEAGILDYSHPSFEDLINEAFLVSTDYSVVSRYTYESRFFFPF